MRRLRLPKSSPIRDCGTDERWFPHLEMALEGRMVLISYAEWDKADRRKALRLARRLLEASR
jgi:hypothetical protein